MRTLRFTLLLMLAVTTMLSAQDREPLETKFGRLLPDDRTALPMGVDSAAEAYVLYDKEDLRLDLNAEGQPVIQRTIHRRVKLIRSSSFDRADIEIVYYPKTQRISNLDAVVHLPGGGVHKLSTKDFVKETYDENRSVVKWTFPRLSEGAIIEYKFMKISESWVIPPRFFFQDDIPTRYTEYRTSLPATFLYVNLGNAVNFAVNTEEQKNRTFNGQIEKFLIHTYAYYDMPAYEIQPYTNNFEDYVPNIRLQLKSYRTYNGGVHEVFSDWKQTAEKMADWDDFGRAYTAGGMSNGAWKEAEPLLAGLATETEKAEALYNFVTKRIVWNGNYDWTADNNPDKTLKEGTGDTGEMAMLLLALLRRADIDAQPALVSLRGRGTPITVFPIMNQFNHVIVVAKLEGEDVLMDPNVSTRPMGLPRALALNGQAMVMDPENPHWIDVDVPMATRTVMAQVTVDETGTGEVDIQSRLRSYYAFNSRNRIKDMESDQEYPLVEEITERFPETELLSKEMVEKGNGSGDFGLNLKMKVPMGDPIDDYLYLQPILLTSLDETLDDVDQRLYPVDFNYPWREQYITFIDLPEGYAVEELPESIRIRSEDGTVSCRMTASLDDSSNKVNVTFDVTMARTRYAAQEYTALKTLFEKIIELQESSIVLKRAK